MKLITSENPDKISMGLQWFSENIAGLEGEDYRQALQAIAYVFTHDTYESPEYQGVVNQAVRLLVSQGELCIPYLLEMLSDSDFKVEFNLALVLGKIGNAAVAPLLEAYNTSRHPAEKAFIIYALGKIESNKIAEAIPLMLTALDDSDREVRDSAARSLGKISDTLGPASFPQELRNDIFERLLPKIKDEYSGVRSKAIRSLGKLSQKGFLTDEQKHKLQTSLVELLGKSGDFIWDSAFIVRREAEAVYKQLTGNDEVQI
jgi:HEAT repeat protein